MAYLSNDNIRHISRNLYIGDYLISINYPALLNFNITHILICAEELSPRFPETFIYKHLNLDDSPTTPISHHFEEAFSFISQGVKSGAVLVHCAQGRSRSVSILTMYLMRSKHISFVEAFKLLKERHKDANPNPGFKKQLIEYEKCLGVKKSECIIIF